MHQRKLNSSLDGLSGCELPRLFIISKKQPIFLNLYPIREVLNEKQSWRNCLLYSSGWFFLSFFVIISNTNLSDEIALFFYDEFHVYFEK